MSETENRKPTIPTDWLEVLNPHFESDDYKYLRSFLDCRYDVGASIFPRKENIFKPFKLTPFSKVKVIILASEPYNAGQANGLAFGVRSNIPRPPVLQNIFQEVESNFNIFLTKTQSSLEGWAEQGVFLLNLCLTVEAYRYESHAGKGWEKLTDFVIKEISNRKDHVVFLLWGKKAEEKKKLIDGNKHFMLTAPHPSPYTAHTGFFGCNHFAQTNNQLRNWNMGKIDWSKIDINIPLKKDVIDDIVGTVDLERGLKNG